MTKWQNHLGLDIGGTSIKVVQLELLPEEKFKLVALGRAQVPKFENQGQWDVARTETIKKLLSDAHVGSKQAAISLPESQVYTRVVEIPFLEEPELSAAITWQAEQYVPVPLSEVVLKHQVLSLPEQGVPGAKMSVLLLAAPNTTISSYSSVVSAAGLEVTAVETETLAVIRALTTGVADFPQSLLVHIGAETTTLCLCRSGLLALTSSVGTGAMAVTRAVATGLGLDQVQAEEYKRSYGLDETKLDGKVAAAIKPVLDFISGEAKKVLVAYESHGVGEKEPVRRVLLSGGGSILPGIVPYFVNVLGLETQLADPFFGLILSESQKREVGEQEPIFSVAVGLAEKPV